MRILLVSNGYPPEARGGVETYTHTLAAAFAARSHQVEVFCRLSHPGLPEYTLQVARQEGISIWRVVNDLTDATRFEAHYRNSRFDPLSAEVVRGTQNWLRSLRSKGYSAKGFEFNGHPAVLLSR